MPSLAALAGWPVATRTEGYGLSLTSPRGQVLQTPEAEQRGACGRTWHGLRYPVTGLTVGAECLWVPLVTHGACWGRHRRQDVWKRRRWMEPLPCGASCGFRGGLGGQ